MSNLVISGVSKTYRNGVKGIDRVSLRIGPGVFGLLGHNGAGKTTLMRAIATILRPTEGTICVMGHDAQREGDAVRRLIGYLPQELGMYANLSAFDFVRYMALLKGVRDDRAVRSALELVDMAEQGERRIGQLSGGMKRRVGIAQAIVGEPDVLIADEPTAGLDPEERVRFRGVLSRYASSGKTVLLSTHIVEDVHQLCAQLAVLRGGKLFFSGGTDQLIRQVAGRVKQVVAADERALGELRQRAVVLSTAYEQAGIRARVMDESGAVDGELVPETLEDAYVYCMGGKDHE